MNDKRAFRIAEIIAAYGIGKTKVYEEIKAGRLKIYKLGRSTLVSRESLDRWQSICEKQAG